MQRINEFLMTPFECYECEGDDFSTCTWTESSTDFTEDGADVEEKSTQPCPSEMCGSIFYLSANKVTFRDETRQLFYLIARNYNLVNWTAKISSTQKLIH